MYADIVVLTYQSPEIDSYTYKIPKNLEKKIKVGQLVEVPFGRRSPLGIIISTNYSSSSLSLKTHQSLNDLSRFGLSLTVEDLRAEGQLPITNYQLKPISQILLQQPIFLPYQIKLLKWMSFYYIAPMVNCLESMLPELPGRLIKTYPYSSSDPEQSRRGVEKFSTSSNNNLKYGNQRMVLVPSINHLPETMARFKGVKNHVIYHNELKKSERFNTWLKILSGKADYIFGSRSAIFTPCPNFKEIIIYDEHNEAYKDERSPYFDTLTIAQKIKEFTRCKLQIFDSSPKITTYFSLKAHIQGEIPKTAKYPPKDEKSKVKIISMQDEMSAGNFSPISTFLHEQLKKNQNSLLFLNKKKESGNMYCKSCKYSDYFEKQPEMCPKCKSPDIYFNVLNINSLQKEISKLTHHSSLTRPTEPWRSGITHHSIDIATASIFYSLTITKYDLVAYIQPDPLLNRADFSSVETLYFQVANLKKLLKENGILIIQTYSPDDETLKSAVFSNYSHFFKNQLENRRLLSYPPFALFVKLTIKGSNQGKVEKLAHQIFADLQSKLQTTNYKLQTNLLGPYKPVFFSKRLVFNIIIKYKLKSYSLSEREMAIKNLQPMLKEISKKAQIIVEPSSIN